MQPARMSFAEAIATMPDVGEGADTAQLWGIICMPETSSVVDRQIAATARIHTLTLVTRRDQGYAGSGIATLNPCLAMGL